MLGYPVRLYKYFMDSLYAHAERLTEDRPELNALEVIHALAQLNQELDKEPETTSA